MFYHVQRPGLVLRGPCSNIWKLQETWKESPWTVPVPWKRFSFPRKKHGVHCLKAYWKHNLMVIFPTLARRHVSSSGKKQSTVSSVLCRNHRSSTFWKLVILLLLLPPLLLFVALYARHFRWSICWALLLWTLLVATTLSAKCIWVFFAYHRWYGLGAGIQHATSDTFPHSDGHSGGQECSSLCSSSDRIFHESLGGGFKYFYFHPYLGKMNPIWRSYFSDGWGKTTSMDFSGSGNRW